MGLYHCWVDGDSSTNDKIDAETPHKAAEAFVVANTSESGYVQVQDLVTGVAKRFYVEEYMIFRAYEER